MSKKSVYATVGSFAENAYLSSRHERKMAYRGNGSRERVKANVAVDKDEELYCEFAAENGCTLADARRRVRKVLRWWDSDEGALHNEFDFDGILADGAYSEKMVLLYEQEIREEMAADIDPDDYADVTCECCGCVVNKQVATSQHGKHLCPGCDGYFTIDTDGSIRPIEFFVGKDGYMRPIEMRDSYLAEQEYNAHMNEEVVCQHCFDKAPRSWMNGYDVCWPCSVEHGDAVEAHMNETVQCVSCGDYHPRHATKGDAKLRLCPTCQQSYAVWQGVVINAESVDWVNDPSHSAVYPEDVCICDGCRNGYGICAYRDDK